jgi:hypothetical protein
LGQPTRVSVGAFNWTSYGSLIENQRCELPEWKVVIYRCFERI